ncbi:hypothetical protein BH10CYA1_BH10CYA1_33810 [soil metagenome]
MNTPTLTKSSNYKKAFAAILPAFALMMGTATAGLAAPNDLVTNAGGNIDDVNPNTAYDIRVNCGKRMPFMQKAWDCDTLEKISSGQSNGDTGDGSGRNGGAGRNQTTGATTSGAGTGSSASGTQSNIKKSKLTGAGDAVKVLAYDIMVKPFGQPGHYLPGADPLHQPQYASQGDSLIQYAQTKMEALDQPKTMRDLELFQNTLTTFGLPCSDTQYQMIDRENNQRMLELACDPERFQWAATTQGQLQTASMANVLAGSSEAAFKQATARIVQADGNGGNGGGGGGGGGGGAQVGALINIANEQSGVPTAADNPNKTVPQAVWMVQQMYKFVFVPLAILFLLPGAVITQVKSQIVQGFKLNAEDQSSPFEGILRSMIAVFLIPATQLIVSYSIDVGNSMAYSVKDWVDLQLIFDWSRELTYNTPLDKVNNAITANGAAKNGGAGAGAGAGGQQQGGGGFLGSISGFLGGIPLVGGALQGAFNSLASFLGASGEGLGSDTPEGQTVAENQTWLSSAMESMFNMATYLFSSAVIVLGAYQLVFVCYLYLLGPLAAAFFAWPRIQASSGQKLFTDVFSNWVNAVIVVSLWRFYWMVLLAIMTQRILYIQDSGGASNLQWEVAVFTCLLGLMMWVPFNPWSFDPAQAFETANAAGQSMMKGASGAMGQAAQAGGMPAGQVKAMQGQINQALQPMQQVSQAMALASNGPTGTASGMYQGTGAIAGANNSSGGSNTSTTSNNVTPPPSANFANASPSTSSPVPTSNQPTTSQPPTSSNSQGNSANQEVAQNAAPNMPVTSMPESASLTPSNEASLAVNGNASTNDVSNAMPEAQVQMASLGVNSGEGNPPSAGGTGGGNEGGGSANMVAMSNPTTSGGQGESQGQGGGNTSGGGSSGDSTIQVASLAAASGTGSSNSGGKENPPNQGPTDNKGNNDQTPPPTAYA